MVIVFTPSPFVFSVRFPRFRRRLPGYPVLNFRYFFQVPPQSVGRIGKNIAGTRLQCNMYRLRKLWIHRERYRFDRLVGARHVGRGHALNGKYVTVSDEFDAALGRASERQQNEPVAVSARYDRRRGRVVISLDTGIELAFPPHLAEGLKNATPADLFQIEISPSGFGIHFPRLDADLYVPALVKGVFGSKSLAAAQLGREGGRSRSRAKIAAARANGKRGGRPRIITAGTRRP